MSRRSFLKLLSLLSATVVAEELGPFARKTDHSAQAAPSVLILVFDTLSAKNASVYGYRRRTTPNLARFAERATVYHAHFAAGNFTMPGTASLLTGTYPWTNRAFNGGGTVVKDYVHRNLFRAFAGETYSKIAYTHNSWANLLLNQFRQDIDIYLRPGAFSLLEGHFHERLFPKDLKIAHLSFEEYLLPSVPQPPGSHLLGLFDDVRASAVRKVELQEYAELYPRGVPVFTKTHFLLEHAIAGVMALTSQSPRPFLGYFHFLPPHHPYTPRREFVDLFAGGWAPDTKTPHFFSQGHSDASLVQNRRHYDEHAAYADAEFGRLYDFLARNGILDHTYLVVTADHGEMFERGIRGHTTETLYDPVIRIPLLISRPGQRQRKDVFTPTSCVDLLPTLLHVAGQPVPEWCEGQLLPKLSGEDGRGERSVFSVEAKTNPKHTPLSRATVALVKGQHKLVHYRGYPGYADKYELYDLENDPEERVDLIAVKKSTAAQLRDELQTKLREVNEPYVG